MNNHIQIGDVTPRIQYAADGSQTQFSYPFPIFVEDDLEVYTGDTKEISGYSVLGAGTSYGGSVTFHTPPASGVVVTLRRSLTIDRTTDFQQSGTFRAKDINDELDSLTAALQQVAGDVSRAVRLRPTDGVADLELPSKDERANKVLGFDASGDVIATSGSGVTGAGVTDHGQLTGLLDDDHSQYHNDARGDARYYTQSVLHAGQLDGRYYTETEVDAQFAALGSAAALDVGTAVADVVQLEDVGGGTPGLPAVDGSQLTGLPGGGDMLAATFDPQGIAADAFDADNHTDGTTNKVYTATEKTKLAAIGTRLTGTGSVAAVIEAARHASFDITVTGAVVGDKVISVVLPATVAADTSIYGPVARVTATNTVTVWLSNLTYESITGLSGTVTAIVEVS